MTQAAVDYLRTLATMTGKTKIEVLNATFWGDLEDYGLKLPSASEGFQLALGAEYRSESLSSIPDMVWRTGNAAGLGGSIPEVNGEVRVNEAFVEGLLPLAQDTRGFQDLSVDLGYRYSDYSTSGGANTYKAQLSWAPTKDVRLRGGLNRAIRSANIHELYTPVTWGGSGLSVDPCANDPDTGVPSAPLEECMRTGVTPEQYGHIPPGLVSDGNTLGGGNPAVTPEQADTLTAGLVITPQVLQPLAVTLDYYDIEFTDAIGVLSADAIMTSCIRSGDPLACRLIHRDASGSLWLTPDGYVIRTSQNIGRVYAEGVDADLSYMFRAGNAGLLTAELTGTYVLSKRLADPSEDYDCAGYYGPICGQPNPTWRHRARLTWDTSFHTSLSLVWRMVGPVEVEFASPDPDLSDPEQAELYATYGYARTPAYHFFDLAGIYTFSGNIQLAVGVNNVLDKEPPLGPGLADHPSVNTYAMYDPLGRYVFSSIRYQF